MDPDKLLRARPTTTHPEVGFLMGRTLALCTGTLVAPRDEAHLPSRFVATAAHCVGFKNGEEPNVRRGLWFHVGGRAYRVVRQRVWLATANLPVIGSYPEHLRDLALLELEEDVPLTVAKPATIADARPRLDDPMVVFGFGCTDRCGGRPEDPPVKRVAETPFGRPSFRLCPGDSGGPLMTAAGDLVGVNSAFGTDIQNDVWADVVGHAVELTGQLRDWREAPWVATAEVPIESLASCEDCANGGGFWCPGRGCYDFLAVAEIVCGPDQVRRYEEDCALPPTDDGFVATHCATATDCRECLSRYECSWTDAGCVDAPGGILPSGVRAVAPNQNPLCCPGPACDRDGRCERTEGETPDNCSHDCRPGAVCDQDGVCEAPENAVDCRTDCALEASCDGDGVCELSEGEWCGHCGDCVCNGGACDADGACEAARGETRHTCEADCTTASDA